MRRRNGVYLYSPSDLISFLDCEYVSWLDRYDLDHPGQLVRDAATEEEQLLRSGGEAHEARYLGSLRSAGKSVSDLAGARDSREATQEAMEEGAEVIYQGYLSHGEFGGYTDFLIRVPGQSVFGPYQYEIYDTKLARHMKPYFAVQLCCYAEMLEALQGTLPEHVGITLGNGRSERLRTHDYWYYYRTLKEAFLEQQRTFDPAHPPQIPPHGEFRHWTSHVQSLLEQRDDLSRVAGIRAPQIKKLHAAGIHTLRQLAETSPSTRVPHLAPATLQRLHTQARLQAASLQQERPEYLPLVPDAAEVRTGLAVLPPASRLDVYFDMEGYPLLDEGLEYLFGATTIEDENMRFHDWWAHDREQEREAFAGFVRWAHERWQEDPAMHIYHYAAYEKSALCRLMGRFGVCERELDDLLRHEVFVDLYSVVRQGMLIGTPSYSLKSVEQLYREKRTGAVANASASIVHYHRWRERPDGRSHLDSATLRQIREYNRDDCESTYQLAEWLRSRQAAHGIAYRPKAGEAPQPLSEATASRAVLAQEMISEATLIEDPERRRVHELLGWLLEFHRREQKPSRWALFERHAMTEEDLTGDPECLGGLERFGLPEPVKRSLRYVYRFDPRQETKLREGNTCCFAHDLDTRVTIDAIEMETGTLHFKLGGGRTAPPSRLSLIPYDLIPPKPIVESIENLVFEYRVTGGLPGALSDFLFRRAPRLRDRASGTVIEPGMPLLDGAIAAVRSLDSSTLTVQGPPGCGKTYTAARMIAALVKDGYRVGVTSNSHRAIALLLREAGQACRQQDIPFTGMKVAGEEDDALAISGFATVATASQLFVQAVLPQIVGGTAWVFSRAEAVGQFDYLFVDEAGQVSVANLTGMAPCARNLVLLGDQRQLNQPVQGTHPGESGKSVLEYLLGDQPTIPPDRGIFLDGTWRMRPEVCSFISDAVYEGRLKPVAATSARRIVSAPPRRRWTTRTEGLIYIPLEHEGSVYESEEEAGVITEVVGELLQHGYDSGNGRPRLLNPSDILIVSPFNLQVRLLRRRLPTVRIGTVDKFQGQEAPVVIYSMTSSSGDSCPRGVEFLFSPNRLNVALSRAQVLAVLVGSAQLGRTRCRRLEQMRLVNLFCRAAQAGTVAAGARR